MKFKLIACINSKNVIGRNGQLLFHIRNDMANFRRMTLGNPIVMGRKTFESFPNKRPLPNRTNIVITSNKNLNVAGVRTYGSVDDVIHYYDIMKHQDIMHDLYIIGGASVYNQFLDKDAVDEVFLTQVVNDNTLTDNDAVIRPDWEDDKKWKKIFESPVSKTDEGIEFKYITYKRKSSCYNA